MKLKLYEFDEGEYIWEITCEDGSGNKNNDYTYFEVDLSGNIGGKYSSSSAASYDREDEVNNLIDDINSFLERESSFGI